MEFEKIGVLADKSDLAQKGLKDLLKSYDLINLDSTDIDEAKPDVVLVLGGDGFMLHALHRFVGKGVPIYGINCGTVGFLMNNFSLEKLKERISEAKPTTINPVDMIAIDHDDKQHKMIAFNEVSLLRSTKQAAKIRISIDEEIRMAEMVCDGVLVATPAGSSAYNASVGGPVLPLNAWLLALTPISPFRPRRWKGAVLKDKASIRFDIKHSHKRPVDAVADFNEVKNVKSVEIKKNLDTEMDLLFDPGHSLEERILKEQFME